MLPEDEKRQLQEIEQALCRDDPKFGRRMRAGYPTAKGTKHRSGQTRRARMMERMEERWRRRQKGNGGMPGRTPS